HNFPLANSGESTLRIRIILLRSLLVRLLATKDTKNFVQQAGFLFVVIGSGRGRSGAWNWRSGEGPGSHAGRGGVFGGALLAAEYAGKPRRRRRLRQHAPAMQFAELRLRTGKKNLFARGRAGRGSELPRARVDFHDADAGRGNEIAQFAIRR